MAEAGDSLGGKAKVLLDEGQISRTLARMTHEIAEQAPDLDNLVLVGIQEGGWSWPSAWPGCSLGFMG